MRWRKSKLTPLREHDRARPAPAIARLRSPEPAYSNSAASGRATSIQSRIVATSRTSKATVSFPSNALAAALASSPWIASSLQSRIGSGTTTSGRTPWTREPICAVVARRVAAPRLTSGRPHAGLSERLELKLMGRQEFRSGAVALRYQPSRVTT